MRECVLCLASSNTFQLCLLRASFRCLLPSPSSAAFRNGEFTDFLEEWWASDDDFCCEGLNGVARSELGCSLFSSASFSSFSSSSFSFNLSFFSISSFVIRKTVTNTWLRGEGIKKK